MRRFILTIFMLCALHPSFAKAMQQPLVPAQEENSIVHDFLHNHVQFKALWGTPEKGETTYLKLPNGVSRMIAREALRPALAMLKKSTALLSATYRAHNTFTQELTTYAKRKTWNYFALQTSQIAECPKPCDGHPITKLAATTSPDCSVQIWDTQTGKYFQTLRGHAKPVRYVQFDPSGNIIATSAEDKTVKLWHAHSGECIYTLSEWFDCPHLQFNKAGSRLVLASTNIIGFWDIATGKHSEGFITDKVIKNISFNNNETHLIALHHPDYSKDEDKHDNFVTIWDVETGTCIRTLRPTPCDLIDASNNLFMIKRGKKHYALWDVGNYCAAVEFLDSVNLEQALLLNCLAHTILINKIIRKKHYHLDKITVNHMMKRFNFNKFPHLQPYFEHLPRELQLGMQDLVVLIGKADPSDDSWCTIA